MLVCTAVADSPKLIGLHVIISFNKSEDKNGLILSSS